MKPVIIKAGYIVTLTLFCTAMSFVGIGYLAGMEWMAQVIEDTGYPPYIGKYIGLCIIFGVIGLWYIRTGFLRDFIYSGFFILLTTFIYSLLISESDWVLIITSISLLLIILLNYIFLSSQEKLKKKSRYMMYLKYKKDKLNENGESQESILQQGKYN